MIATSDLRAMPSSLNDACRKMEMAADCIDAIKVYILDPDSGFETPAETRIVIYDRLVEILYRAGRSAGEPPNDANDFYARGEHMPGVTK